MFEALREAWAARGGGGRGRGRGHGPHRPHGRPAGGALTVGLGLVDSLAVVPHFGDEHDDAHGQKLQRTVALRRPALPVVGLPERTALIRDGDGTWRSEGAGTPVVFVERRGRPRALGAPAGAEGAAGVSPPRRW